jgi:hypothetical protein
MQISRPGSIDEVKKWINIKIRKRYVETDLLREFPLYVPCSAGEDIDRAKLTVQTIRQIFPFLSSLVNSVGARKASVLNIKQYPSSREDLESVEALKKYLDSHGSDKANQHNYHYLYGVILKNRTAIKGVLEIGMGSNNTDVVSNMGTGGKPGASLRSFRDFLASAKIYGADVDKRILFQEERIKTFYVDQIDPSSFMELDKSIPPDLDLVIDDGLHSPDANVETLKFGLTKIRVGGWVVVEDIGLEALPLWEVVAALLPNHYEPHILSDEGCLVFAVKKLT